MARRHDKHNATQGVSPGQVIADKMSVPCPIDGCMCSSPYFRKIGKAGALKASGIPRSMRVAWGRMGGRGNKRVRPSE